MSSNPSKASGDSKGVSQYDKKGSRYYDKWGHGNYTIRATNALLDPENYESDSLSEYESDIEFEPATADPKQENAYHVGVTHTVEDFFGRCYNCGEEGHAW